ncbi:Phenoloxidase-activating factor 1, partial [Pseudolycoriella hygida]
MFSSSVLQVITMFLLIHDKISIAEIGDYMKCTSSQDCMEPSSCTTLNYNFASLSENEQLMFLNTTQCAGDKTNPLICCNNFEIENELPSIATCSKPSSDYKVTGGVDALLHDYSWMTLLEHKNLTTNMLYFNGAGSLISSRYVLTVAHVAVDHKTKKTFVLQNVHLGKYDRNKTENIDTEGNIGHPTVVVGIDKVIPHPDRDGTTNDIALIRLSKRVFFTEFIVPVCLPSMVQKTELKDEYPLEVSAWGEGTSSTAKQKLAVPYFEHSDCQRKYDEYSEIKIKESQICAGGVGDKLEGTCQGDSGGPLMSQFDKYAIEGIVLFGDDVCARGNSSIPFVNINVRFYETWINETIAQH